VLEYPAVDRLAADPTRAETAMWVRFSSDSINAAPDDGLPDWRVVVARVLQLYKPEIQLVRVIGRIEEDSF